MLAREDTTKEAGHVNRVDAHGRAELDGDAGARCSTRGRHRSSGSRFGLTVDLVKPKTGPQLDLFGPPDECE